MTISTEILSGILGTVKNLIIEEMQNYEKDNHPDKHIRRIFSEAELTHVAPLDSECIFFENRLQIKHLLRDGMSDLSRDVSSFFTNQLESIDLPIAKITQIWSSNSDSMAEKWKSIYDFGKYTHDSGYFKNSDNIDSLIRHVKTENSRFKVSLYKWNNQWLWENTGGSHHFAMAVYHSINRCLSLTLPVQLTTYTFDETKYWDYSQKQSVFVTHENNLKPVYDLKWKYHFEVQSINYPLNESRNAIFAIPSKSNVARIITSEYGLYFLPFHRFIQRL